MHWKVYLLLTEEIWRIASSGVLTPCDSCKNRRFGGT
jgi:hypothetical protein